MNLKDLPWQSFQRNSYIHIVALDGKTRILPVVQLAIPRDQPASYVKHWADYMVALHNALLHAKAQNQTNNDTSNSPGEGGDDGGTNAPAAEVPQEPS